MLLWMWKSGCDSSKPHRLEPELRRADYFASAVNWKLELPVSVALLDTKEPGRLGASVVEEGNRTEQEEAPRY